MPPPDSPSGPRASIASSPGLVVVKVGTRVLTGADGRLDGSRIDALGKQVDALRSMGRQVVVVSSGAVGAGLGRMGLDQRPHELAHLQAIAAIGQSCLIEAWERALRGHGRHAAQVLLVADDLQHRSRYLNIRNTLRALLDYGAVPVINENDTVSVEELRTSFGDNDRLAALVATLLGAPLLVLLSDVDGLFDRHPSEPEARVLREVAVIDAGVEALARDRPGGLSKGGMASKLTAARIVTEAGGACVIAPGRDCLSRSLSRTARRSASSIFPSPFASNRRSSVPRLPPAPGRGGSSPHAASTNSPASRIPSVCHDFNGKPPVVQAASSLHRRSPQEPQKLHE